MLKPTTGIRSEITTDITAAITMVRIRITSADLTDSEYIFPLVLK
jgi:hypothetical protein